MKSKSIKQEPIDRWLIDPMTRFIKKSTSGGLVLFGSAILALIIANSPWSDDYHALWKHTFTIGYDSHFISKNLHHWINDGLMAVFFFVIGLELKREIRAGELSNPKEAILPLSAAIGGMLLPAIIYLFFNNSGEASNGWGIPMATDIAFALGVLYLLGDKVPRSVKVFLTVLAIADDVGAVLVIALFYTSEINFDSLAVGGVFMMVLMTANMIGVRNTLFYAVVGIGGLWLAFLMSGIHATIAAVLAAFTIPASVKIPSTYFSGRMNELMSKYKSASSSGKLASTEQMYIVDEVKQLSKRVIAPLQSLEHSMHPLVAFVIMPIFAFSNAGVTLAGELGDTVLQPVSMGIFFGLILGKVLGITGIVWAIVKTGLAKLPEGMNLTMLVGISFLAAVGFTMSLFITDLAFTNEHLRLEAKVGVLLASISASVAGYFIIRYALKKTKR